MNLLTHKCRIIMAFIIAATALTGCSSLKNTEEIESNALYIPILAEMGWLYEDKDFLEGITLGADVFERKGNFSIHIEYFDDNAEYLVGVENAKKIAADERFRYAINLQEFDISEITIPMLTGNDIKTLLPYSAYSSVLEDNPLAISLADTSEQIGEKIVDIILRNDYKNVAFYLNGTDSQRFIANFIDKKLYNLGEHDRIIDFNSNIISDMDFAAQYKKYELMGIDCFVILQYGSEEAKRILECFRRFSELPVIGEPISLVGAKDKNLILPDNSVNIPEDFFKLYQESYNKDPSEYSYLGYKCIELIYNFENSG